MRSFFFPRLYTIALCFMVLQFAMETIKRNNPKETNNDRYMSVKIKAYKQKIFSPIKSLILLFVLGIYGFKSPIIPYLQQYLHFNFHNQYKITINR